ncbi:MAG: hypothetical protein EOO96_22355 [Pedobacter sp.]|nr:MAG: hypothetical protein EOO96_22355 [Pedobacter sp.]
MIKSFFTIIFFFGLSSSAQQKGISIADKIISISGRKLEINADGFPKQIQSFYDWQFNAFGFKPTNLLYEPIHFHFFTSPKTQEKLVVGTFNLLSEGKDSIIWEATSSSANVSQYVKAKMIGNGLINYHVNLRALKDVSLSTINFHIPFEKGVSKYLMGLGNKANLRPDTVKWCWEMVDEVNPEVLIGNDNAALYFDINQHKTLEILHIKNGWLNGMMQINIKGSSMLTEFSTGAVALKAGNELAFDFNLLLLPMNRKDGRRSLEKRFQACKDLIADGKKPKL